MERLRYPKQCFMDFSPLPTRTMSDALRNPTPAAEWQGWETEVGKLNSEIQEWMIGSSIGDEETLVGPVEP